MSTFLVEVCELRNVHKHPNADTLSCGLANGYPVLFKSGEHAEGDHVVYIPVDAIVPATPEWDWLGSSRRIKAKKLRGIYSEGLIVANQGWKLGQNVQELLGITKWLPPSEREDGVIYQGRTQKTTRPRRAEKCPYIVPVYDIEGYRKFSHVLHNNETVSVTEKLHGTSFRALHDGTRLWVASRNVFWRESKDSLWRRFYNWVTRKQATEDSNLWWQAARKYNLSKRLADFPGFAVYGELIGEGIQDLTYGAKLELYLYDIYDVDNNRWLDVNEFRHKAAEMGLQTVPELYYGSFHEGLTFMAEGKSTLKGANNVREGVVFKPVTERWHANVGRVFLKLVGEGYLTRKGAPE